jgi:hypothetical protein
MSLVFESVASARVTYAHAVFEVGASIVLGADGQALDEIAALAQGELAPRRGSVLSSGTAPAISPRARRLGVTLRAVESLPPATNVSAALGLLLAARGLALSARELLERWELGAWASRRSESLSPAELRALALTIALADERAEVLVLYEPLATGLPSGRVREALAQRAVTAAVVVLTASLDDARSIGGYWYLLDAGTLLPAHPNATLHGLARQHVLVVRSPDARRLAALAAADPSIAAVEWHEPRDPHELRLHGRDAGALALALTRLALDHGVRLELVAPVSPSLDALLVAQRALVQQAYEAAYQRPAAPIFATPAPLSAAAPAPAPYAEYQSPGTAAPDQSVSFPAPGPERQEP